MPWDSVRMNSVGYAGYSIPNIAWGTWKTGNDQVSTDRVKQALDIGFKHIDTAQAYRNETEAGIALRETSLSREDLFITTKYSGTNGLDVDTSIRNSLGVEYVDLYLIHSPRLAVPDIPTAWAKMEKIKEAGLARCNTSVFFVLLAARNLQICRSIGVSNFDEKDLKVLLASAKIKPDVNQILLHPYVYRRQLPILEYAARHDIVIEAYSALIPITHEPGGPLDAPLNRIASRLGATTDQVLLAWTKAKGAVVVT
ncbi:NADP-dependent oxidoreductase domain-containing protein [Boletus reticuloceps]|uniref:NADP-dependent oxidoreductase domain-containing protein n=1 Tax=Boletus reticuloceps TaxID=495285 RepID=A0A8I2YIP0_9AGAM|nr:NADP-dependent oxidoreductase domain-containing protein [Boletus reticuloceps]